MSVAAQTVDDQAEWLSEAHASKILKIGKVSLRYHRRRNAITAKKVGEDYFYKRPDIMTLKARIEASA